MDHMRIDYEPALNILDETNALTIYDINPQNNIISRLIALMFSIAILNCESAREVHASEPFRGKKKPWEVEPSEMNPQCSWYQTKLIQFSSMLAGCNI